MLAIPLKMKINFALIIFKGLLFFGIGSLSAEVIPLNGKQEHIALVKEQLPFFVDTSGSITIQDILSEKKTIAWQIQNTSPIFIKNSGDSYWFKISIENNSSEYQHYLIESYNYRIDSLVMYETQNNILLKSERQGVGFPFNMRNIKHKNLVYSFWFPPGEKRVLYLKANNRFFTPVELVLRKFEYFTSYAIHEYFFLGLFYGSILIVFLLNVLAGIFVRRISHYFYAAYIFFVGLFFLSQDGAGFQFLWPNWIWLNDYMYMFANYLMIVFLLLYTSSFLNLKTHQPLFHKGFLYFIILRTFLVGVNLMFFPEIRHVLYIDVLPFLFAYYCAFVAYRSKYPLSGYFFLGFTILVIGFNFNLLRLLGVVESTVWSFYLVNFCFLFEMIIFYFALAERIRFYKQNSRDSKELKNTLKDKERLIEQITYKTSHDLSGPVKSIIGVSNLALSSQGENSAQYFEMIKTTAERLDQILLSITEINVVREHEILETHFNLSVLLNELKPNFKLKPEDELTIHVPNHLMLGDAYLLYSIFNHLILFYLDSIQYKAERKILLDISIEQGLMRAHISSNGKAIPESAHARLFDIFFRISNSMSDLGTHMHLVKAGLDKLEGEIVVLNNGSSTTMDLVIPLVG
jgi:signal transduction histidine kinase